MTRMQYDVIVAGVGGMGSAACYHLATRGVSVLGLERYGIPHEHGSSHGLTRIIRLAYHEGPDYVPLVRRAMVLWQELGARFGEQLLFRTGCLDLGPGGGAFFKDSLAACHAHDLPHEILSAAEINVRFPAFRLPATQAGLYQPDGGFVASERAIAAHATLAKSAGAEIHTHEPIQGWEPLPGGGLCIRTGRGAYECGRLIVTAGAWLGELVPALKPLAIPERQVIAWFAPRDEAAFLPSAMPVTILMVDEGPYFTLPIWGRRGVKVGLHHHRYERGEADSLRRAPDAEDEALLRLCVARYMPEADGPLVHSSTCLYTNTPDEHFMIDNLPEMPEVIVASPCSGHGYKFASAIGEILADLAMDRGSRFDLSMFRLDRF
jgi:sarcosine oxidase